MGRPSAAFASLSDLFDVIYDAWGEDTSADEDWTAKNPALGQCAVTALVVQDALGGDLLRSTVGGVSHYWNRLDGGEWIDLTRGQFSLDAMLDEPPVLRERGYVLSFPETVKRYEILRDRVRRTVLLP